MINGSIFMLLCKVSSSFSFDSVNILFVVVFSSSSARSGMLGVERRSSRLSSPALKSVEGVEDLKT